jgi:hypothetical protein
LLGDVSHNPHGVAAGVIRFAHAGAQNANGSIAGSFRRQPFLFRKEIVGWDSFQ